MLPASGSSGPTSTGRFYKLTPRNWKLGVTISLLGPEHPGLRGWVGFLDPWVSGGEAPQNFGCGDRDGKLRACLVWL